MVWLRGLGGTRHRSGDCATFPELHERLDAKLKPAVDFWTTQVDREHGGFYGAADRRGRPIAGANKTLVQQARHLWTFSELHSSGEGDSSAIEAICDHQYRFLRDAFHDPARAQFHASVRADGSPTGEGIHHYLVAFGVFGLANYARAFPARPSGRDALDTAIEVFDRTVTESWSDDHGFDETVYPARWAVFPKELNTQMHLLEALVALFEATRAQHHSSETEVRSILDRQFDLVAGRGIATRDGRTFCSRGYEQDWTLADVTEVDYGHEIEIVYLVTEAAQSLGRAHERAVVDAVIRLGRSTRAAAFDRRRGKWFYSGHPLSGKVLCDVANFWTNFEALNGLSVLYDLTGEQDFVEDYDRVLAWLETKQRNHHVGEWHYDVDKRGRPVDSNMPGAERGWTSFAWKASYHSVRALLNGKSWARRH